MAGGVARVPPRGWGLRVSCWWMSRCSILFACCVPENTTHAEFVFLKQTKPVAPVPVLDVLPQVPQEGFESTWLVLKPDFPAPIVSAIDRALWLALQAARQGDRDAARGWLLAARERVALPDEGTEPTTREQQMVVDQLLDARALLTMEAEQVIRGDAAPDTSPILLGVLWTAHRTYWEHLKTHDDLTGLRSALETQLSQVEVGCENGELHPAARKMDFHRVAAMVDLLALSAPTRSARLRRDALRLRAWAEHAGQACSKSVSLRWRLLRLGQRR